MKKTKRALLRVDMLNAFAATFGNLYVQGGEGIIDRINNLSNNLFYDHRKPLEGYVKANFFDVVIDIQDWHPEGHGSFASAHGVKPFTMGTLDGRPQMMWPDHAIQNTRDADFHSRLDRSMVKYVIQKGMNPKLDSYSGFFDNDYQEATGLHMLLQSLGVTEVWIVGLALDYCVKFTAIDAVAWGYSTHLLLNCTKCVDPDAQVAVVSELMKEGVEVWSSPFLPEQNIIEQYYHIKPQLWCDDRYA